MAVLLVSSLGYVDLGGAESKYFYGITIESPITGATLNTDNVTVKLQVTHSPWLEIDSLQANCYLDNQLYTQVQLLEATEGYLGTSKNSYTDMTPSIANGELFLQKLSRGSHTLEVNATGKGQTIIINSVSVNEDLNSVVATFYVNVSSTTPIPNTSITSFSTLAMVLSGVVAGAVIVSIALLVIYRKQSLKRKE
jgi:hypothetical protein